MRGAVAVSGWLVAAAVAVGGAAHGAAQTGAAQTRAAQERARLEPRLHEVLRGSSALYAVTHRAGLLSFLGHEHALVPTEWTAALCLADPVPAGAYGTIVIRTASLVIDSDSARALAGLGSGPGEEDRREIQRKVLDPAHLDAAGFPAIRLEVSAVRPAGDRVEVVGEITVRGVTRPIRTRVRIDRAVGGVVLSGRLPVRQTDFGIEPESVAGVVRVADEVDLHFRLVAGPTNEACQPRSPESSPASPPAPTRGGRIAPEPGRAPEAEARA